MYKKILVPLDGSDHAEAILPHVENLARHEGAKIVFASVVTPVSQSFVLDPHAPPKYNFDQASVDKAWAYLQEKQAEFQAKGMNADPLLMYGPSVEGIIHAANEAKADLIALTSRGKTNLKKVIYGSTASGVLNRVKRPLLLVHELTEVGKATNNNILVPLDGSPRSEKVMPHVEGVAKLYDAQVTLLRVIVSQNIAAAFEDLEKEVKDEAKWHGHLLEKLGHEHQVKFYKEARAHLLGWRDKLQNKGVNTKAILMRGRPVEAISTVAKDLDTDLIVMTNKGRTGLAEVFYGSVASGVMNRIFRPLLLIRSD